MKQNLLSIGAFLVASVSGHARDAFTRLEPREARFGVIADVIPHSPRIVVPEHLQERASPSLSSLYRGSPYLNSNTER